MDTDFDQDMLVYLVCPVTGGALKLSENQKELVSRSAKLAYPIRQGIPILRFDQARGLEEEEL